MAYVVEARSEGEEGLYRGALGMLVFRWEGIFLNRAERRIAPSCRESGTLSVAEEAAEIVLETFKDVIQGLGRFEGVAAGQFHKYAQTILDRRVADWFRARNGSPAFHSYDGSRTAMGEESGLYEVVGDGGVDVESAVEIRILWDQALAAEKERDALVVLLKARGHTAAEVVELIEQQRLDGGEALTTDNVDTIYSRFRKKNRDLFLEGSDLGVAGSAHGEEDDGHGQG